MRKPTALRTTSNGNPFEKPSPGPAFGTPIPPDDDLGTGWAFNLADSEALNCCPSRWQVAPHRCGLPPFERMKYLTLLVGWKWRKARRALSAWLTR